MIDRPRLVRLLAIGVGFLILLQGLMGLALPDPFVGLVGAFQVPPALYIAAVVRMTIGAILFLAAPGSHAPVALRVLGSIIFIGGVLTAVIGPALADSILGWWKDGGRAVVRTWGAVALALGTYIIYATLPRSPR